MSMTKIRVLTKPGLHNDSPTLYLNIPRNSRKAKTWIQRITIIRIVLLVDMLVITARALEDDDYMTNAARLGSCTEHRV